MTVLGTVSISVFMVWLTTWCTLQSDTTDIITSRDKQITYSLIKTNTYTSPKDGSVWLAENGVNVKTYHISDTLLHIEFDYTMYEREWWKSILDEVKHIIQDEQVWLTLPEWWGITLTKTDNTLDEIVNQSWCPVMEIPSTLNERLRTQFPSDTYIIQSYDLSKNLDSFQYCLGVDNKTNSFPFFISRKDNNWWVIIAQIKDWIWWARDTKAVQNLQWK